MSAASSSQRDLFPHKTWLNLLEGHKVGIVVSPPALVAAQAHVNADVIPAQNTLLALLTDKPRDLRDTIAERWGQTDDVVLPNLSAFCETVLDWRPGDLLPLPPDETRFSVFLADNTIPSPPRLWHRCMLTLGIGVCQPLA